MSLKFGTSGLRGLSVDLEGRASAVYATAFARYLLASGKVSRGDTVLVARDFRASSPAISATCIGALRRAGLEPVDCGTIPTPALALYGLSINAASLMITGSHIPADRNGIKFYRPDGEIDKQDEVAIATLAAEVQAEDIVYSAGEAEDRSATAREMFVARNTAILPSGALSGLRVGVYQHSTVARDLFVEVLKHYGAEVLSLDRSETFIPVDTEAVSAATLDLLIRRAEKYGLHAIVSADGDGDRPLLADEKGVPLRGDLLGLIAARFLGAEVLVTPVTSNSRIETSGPFTTVRTKVGSPFVIAGMNEALAAGRRRVTGFEANGGTLTASPFEINGHTLAPLPTRDSFLPVLAALFLAVKEKKPLSRVAADFGLAFAAADRLENFPLDISSALMAFLRESEANLAAFLSPVGSVASFSDIDGLRVALTNGRTIHFRPSGNAPEMRCYVEAESEPAANMLLAQGLDLISRFRRSRER